MGKNEANEGWGSILVGTANLKTEPRRSHRSIEGKRWRKEASDVWGDNIPSGGKSQCKGLEVGISLLYFRKARVAGADQPGGESRRWIQSAMRGQTVTRTFSWRKGIPWFRNFVSGWYLYLLWAWLRHNYPSEPIPFLESLACLKMWGPDSEA